MAWVVWTESLAPDDYMYSVQQYFFYSNLEFEIEFEFEICNHQVPYKFFFLIFQDIFQTAVKDILI